MEKLRWTRNLGKESTSIRHGVCTPRDFRCVGLHDRLHDTYDWNRLSGVYMHDIRPCFGVFLCLVDNRFRMFRLLVLSDGAVSMEDGRSNERTQSAVHVYRAQSSTRRRSRRLSCTGQGVSKSQCSFYCGWVHSRVCWTVRELFL